MPESQRFIQARLALNIDQARLLPRFRTPNWATPAPLIETDHHVEWRPADPSNPIVTWTAEDLRGIPIIGRGSSGTQPGTNPLTAIIHNNAA